MYISVYYINIDMQQKLLSVIYKLKYCRTFGKISINFECPNVCKVLMLLMYGIKAQYWPKYAPSSTL